MEMTFLRMPSMNCTYSIIRIAKLNFDDLAEVNKKS